jgi:hypothetical protein
VPHLLRALERDNYIEEHQPIVGMQEKIQGQAD